MGVIGRLFEQLRSNGPRGQELTPAQVRDLIDLGQIDAAEQAIDQIAVSIKDREAHVQALRGEIAFLRHRDDEAEQYYRRALEANPGLPAAHYGLSLLVHARGDKESALKYALFAINGDRKQARYHAQAGLCHLELLNFSRAESALMLATRLGPDNHSAWNNLGIAQRARGNLAGALACFGRALVLKPGFASAMANAKQLEQDVAQMGGVLRAPPPVAPPAISDPDLLKVHELSQSSQGSRAIELCESLLLSRPADSAVPVTLARLYRAHGDPQSGIDVLRAFLASHPDDEDAIVSLGKLLAAEHDSKGAEPLLEAALKARPNDAELWHELADIRSDQDRIAEAGPMYERAYELNPTIENKARVVVSLVSRCRYEDALRLIDELLAEAPNLSEELVGFRVYALTSLGRHDEAMPLLDRAVSERPSDPIRRYPRAVIHLLNERYDLGWEDYRYRSLSTSKDFRMLPFQEWQGEPLEGKTVVVLAEQGLGDQVMFASCLPDLLALRPKKVWVEAIDRVAPTLARSFPQCEVIATNQGKRLDWVRKLEGVDYFVPLADLPRWFRRSAQSFPAHSGYLRADEQRVEYWSGRLRESGQRPKIGVSWRGGSEGTRRPLRTIDVAMLSPLWRAIDADWVCLQYGSIEHEVEAARAGGQPMLYWPESIENLDEFAALVAALDLVITVCNTTVHYGGALARPTWILSPKVPEWRYGLRTTSLPWYPSTRVFRQTELGRWDDLLERVGHEVSAWGKAG